MPSPANSEQIAQISSGFSSNATGNSTANSNLSGGEKFFNNPSTSNTRDSYKCMQKNNIPLNFTQVDRRKSFEERNSNLNRFTSQETSYNFGSRHNNFAPHSSTDRVLGNSSTRSNQRNISTQFFPISYYGSSSEIDYFSSCSAMGFPVNKNSPLDYSKTTYSAVYGMQEAPPKPGFGKQSRNSFVNPGFGKISHL